MPDELTPQDDPQTTAPQAAAPNEGDAAEAPTASESVDDAVTAAEVGAALDDVQAQDAAAAALAAAEALSAATEGEATPEDVDTAMQAMIDTPSAADSIVDAAPEAAMPDLPEGAESFAMPDLQGMSSPDKVGDISFLDDVELDVKIELGRANLYIEDVLKLAVGSVVELDKLAGDPVDIYVNERLVARGEVLILNENFCVRINDIISSIPEPESER